MNGENESEKSTGTPAVPRRFGARDNSIRSATPVANVGNTDAAPSLTNITNPSPQIYMNQSIRQSAITNHAQATLAIQSRRNNYHGPVPRDGCDQVARDLPHQSLLLQNQRLAASQATALQRRSLSLQSQYSASVAGHLHLAPSRAANPSVPVAYHHNPSQPYPAQIPHPVSSLARQSYIQQTRFGTNRIHHSPPPKPIPVVPPPSQRQPAPPAAKPFNSPSSKHASTNSDSAPQIVQKQQQKLAASPPQRQQSTSPPTQRKKRRRKQDEELQKQRPRQKQKQEQKDPPQKITNSHRQFQQQSQQHQYQEPETQLAKKSTHEDQTIRQRSVLVDKYSPFIAPSDKSLKDARTRLETALAQVRKLRCAFTERVYGKYRVCLKPPASLDETIHDIKSDPAAALKKLEETMKQIKDEKDLEKKEAQALNAEFNKMDPLAIAIGADNAEQLMYASAGLSLVILPEDDVDPKFVTGYSERGPVNPATRQRVRSISQAAATAGEIILDRARKAAAMRNQWRQEKKLPHFEEADSMRLRTGNDSQVHGEGQQPISPIDLIAACSVAAKPHLTTPVQANHFHEDSSPCGTNQVARVSTEALPPEIMAKARQSSSGTLLTSDLAQVPESDTAHAHTRANSDGQPDAEKGVKSRFGRTCAPWGTVQTSISAAKVGRSRGGAGISVNISLSLDATADEITLNPEKMRRASTSALAANGTGSAHGTSRASLQQRLRHPHVESLGGRQRASSAASTKKEFPTLLQDAVYMSTGISNQDNALRSYLKLALPPLPTTEERRNHKASSILNQEHINTTRATQAIESVLENFRSASGEIGYDSPLLGRTTLLRGIQRVRFAEMKRDTLEPQALEKAIDPNLAYSVLQTIGLLQEAEKDSKTSLMSSLDSKVSKLGETAKRKLPSVTRLNACWGEIGLTKRPRLSHRFSAKSKNLTENTKTTAASNAPETKIQKEPSASVKASGVQSIRGGGELLSDSNDDHGPAQEKQESNARKINQRLRNSGYSNRFQNFFPQNNGSQHVQQTSWEDPSRVSMAAIDSNVAIHNLPAHQQQSASTITSYHQTAGLNAMHFANQLRHAASNGISGLSTNASRTGRDMQVEAFMGGLTSSNTWPSAGTSTSAMAAAQTSLAVLGLHPLGIYHSVQDEAAARALLAREEQNVAAAHAVASHQPTQATLVGGAANPGFTPSTASLQQSTHSSMLQGTSRSFAGGVINSPEFAAASGSVLHSDKKGLYSRGAFPSGPPGRRIEGGDDNANGQQCPVNDRSPPAASQPVVGTKRRAEQLDEAKPDASFVLSRKESNNTTAIENQKLSPTHTGHETLASTIITPGENLPAIKATKKSALGDLHSPWNQRKKSSLSSQAAFIRQEGMQLFLPKAPASLSKDQEQFVQMGCVHRLFDDKNSESANSSDIMDYLVSMGAAVPIPKAFVSSVLKDRLGSSGFKTIANSAGFIVPKEIVAAVILVWLWNNHEVDFQSAFARSGRIDVDLTCNWLVQTAVDCAVRALAIFIHKVGYAGVSGTVSKRNTDSSVNTDAVSVLVVGKALTAQYSIRNEVDHLLPHIHQLADFLDDCRMAALQSRSQERVLLANLISLKSVMSESFAHAYVSSLVRAGDALGHDALADIVVDEGLRISSMLPYDILKDATGAWEDPCRQKEGFTPNLTGDVLTKVAHARAMIQKSLRRLQDRHGIKSGTPSFGSYVDLSNGVSKAPSAEAAGANSSIRPSTGSGVATPKSWSRRKLNGVLEGPAPRGTGSGHATDWASYEPKHFSAPLSWNAAAPESNPYGKHRAKKTLHLSATPNLQRQTKANSESGANSVGGPCLSVLSLEKTVPMSSHGIDWTDIADSFEEVRLPRCASSQSSFTLTSSFQTIFSPFCRKLQMSPVASDDESETEEDLSDEAVIARHQVVLDEMKEKLTAFMEARKKQLERRKKTQKKSDL